MTIFKIHTTDSAPEKSREILKNIKSQWDFIPNMIGEMAESPASLRGWWDLRSASESGNFSPVERHIVHMTTSHLNNCGYCVAAWTTFGERGDVSRELLNNLRSDRPLKEPKLEQLRQFTKAVVKKMGRPDRPDIDAFMKAGYTSGHILEVIMGVSLSIMGNYINHIAETPLDRAFEANKVESRRSDSRSAAA